MLIFTNLLSDMIGLFRRLSLGGNLTVTRHLSSEKRKRFYKNVSVVQNNGKFEINLGKFYFFTFT